MDKYVRIDEMFEVNFYYKNEELYSVPYCECTFVPERNVLRLRIDNVDYDKLQLITKEHYYRLTSSLLVDAGGEMDDKQFVAPKLKFEKKSQNGHSIELHYLMLWGHINELNKNNYWDVF